MSREYLNTMAALAILTRRLWYQMESLRKTKYKEDAYNTAEAIRHTMLKLGKELDELEEYFPRLRDPTDDMPF